MSTYFIVRLRAESAPEGLEQEHRDDQLALNRRGRPCALSQAAQLESPQLAAGLREASLLPLISRCGEGTRLEIESGDEASDDAAERIANDSEAVRSFLASLQEAETSEG